MYRTILVIGMIVASTRPAPADPPSDELVENLTKVIREHCPDASFATTASGFVAKSGTMTFTLHARGKTGEVSERTYQEEGPNWKGFLLRVELRGGKYAGAAVIPQTFQEPYFETFIDGPNVEGADEHHFVSFSYGSRLDPKLKNAVMAAIPRTQFKKGQDPERGGR